MSKVNEILYNNIVINKDSNVPVYLQLVHQIKSLILQGKLSKGDRLPPERDLALTLKISRNRVGAAYKELESEGIITSHQGKGTFIEEFHDIVKPQMNMKKLNLFLDLAIEEAMELQMNFDEFFAVVDSRIYHRKALLDHIKLIFIECNNEQLLYFSNKLLVGTTIEIIPMLISEMDKKRDIIQGSNIIVTTVSHYDQVCKYLRRNNIDIDVVPLSLYPRRESLVRVAKIPDNSNIGIACKSEKYIEMIERLLPDTLVNFKSIKTNCKEIGDPMANFFKDLDYVIVSHSRVEEIKSLAPPEVGIIEFVFEVDKGSMVSLNSKINSLKSK